MQAAQLLTRCHPKGLAWVPLQRQRADTMEDHAPHGPKRLASKGANPLPESPRDGETPKIISPAHGQQEPTLLRQLCIFHFQYFIGTYSSRDTSPSGLGLQSLCSKQHWRSHSPGMTARAQMGPELYIRPG